MPLPAFPPGDITILDKFDRANGAVYAGAGSTLWQTIRRDGAASDLVIAGNQVTTTGAGERGGATTETVTDFIRIITVATMGVGFSFFFGFRLSSLGASHDGYIWILTGGTWTLYSITDGVMTAVGAGSGASLNPGNQVAFRSVGNVHEVWVNGSGTPAWPDTPVASVTDTDSLYSSGCCSLETANTGWIFDNYASASLSAPTAGVTIIVDPDHSAASDLHSRTQASNASTPLASVTQAAFLARATPTWHDEILVKRCTTANLGVAHDPHLYPALEHLVSIPSGYAPWPMADNSGNQTIVLRGDTSASTGDFDNLPKIHYASYRQLKNWKFQDIQFGYDKSSEGARVFGIGWDYLTWGVAEKVQDITYQGCLFTGGGMMIGNWSGDFTVHQCRVHAPLSPSQFGVNDGEGFGFSGSATDGSVDIAHGHLFFTECEFLEIRGNDAIRGDGCFSDGVTWDDDFDIHVTDCIFRNVTEQNIVYHTDSLQLVSVPRATIQRCVFIGCTDALMLVDVHNGVIRFENNLIAGPLSPTPIQVAATDHLIIRHCTIDVKETTPQDASLGFVTKLPFPQGVKLTLVNSIIGGIYMRDSTMEDYFHEDSVIENNIITSNPGLVTPFGTNLSGLPEYGTSARLAAIPNQVVTVAEQSGGSVTGTIPRTWELATSPPSPGIGGGQATDIASDYFGRTYASPPDVGCFQSSVSTVVTPTPRAPYILTRSPAPGSPNVLDDVGVSITLLPTPGVHVNAATVTANTFYVRDADGVKLPVLSRNVVGDTLTLDIDGDLYALATYTAVLTTGVTDTDGNHFNADQTWSFRVKGPFPLPAVWSAGTQPQPPDPVVGNTYRWIGNLIRGDGTTIAIYFSHLTQQVTTIRMGDQTQVDATDLLLLTRLGLNMIPVN